MNCDGEHDIMWMNFNQDGTSLSAGAKSGFYLYGLSNATEKLDVNINFHFLTCLFLKTYKFFLFQNFSAF